MLRRAFGRLPLTIDLFVFAGLISYVLLTFSEDFMLCCLFICSSFLVLHVWGMLKICWAALMAQQTWNILDVADNPQAGNGAQGIELQPKPIAAYAAGVMVGSDFPG